MMYQFGRADSVLAGLSNRLAQEVPATTTL